MYSSPFDDSFLSGKFLLLACMVCLVVMCGLLVRCLEPFYLVAVL